MENDRKEEVPTTTSNTSAVEEAEVNNEALQEQLQGRLTIDVDVLAEERAAEAKEKQKEDEKVARLGQPSWLEEKKGERTLLNSSSFHRAAIEHQPHPAIASILSQGSDHQHKRETNRDVKKAKNKPPISSSLNSSSFHRAAAENQPHPAISAILAQDSDHQHRRATHGVSEKEREQMIGREELRKATNSNHNMETEKDTLLFQSQNLTNTRINRHIMKEAVPESGTTGSRAVFEFEQVQQSLLYSKEFVTDTAPLAEDQRLGAYERLEQTVLGSKQDIIRTAAVAGDQLPGAYASSPTDIDNNRDDVIPDPRSSSSSDTGTSGADMDHPRPATTTTAPHPITSNGLAVAQPVDDEEAQEVVPAEEVGLEGARYSKALRLQKERQMTIRIFLATLLGVVVLVLIIVFSCTRSGDDNVKTNGPGLPEQQPTLSPLDHLWSLLPNHTKHVIDIDDGSPQAQAFQWMEEDPALGGYIEERLLDRFALSTFYYATDGKRWADNMGWLEYGVHECNWTSTKVYDFYQYSYDEEVIDVTEGASRCKPCSTDDTEWCKRDIILFGNKVSGTLPEELFLMRSLEGIVLDVNELSYTIPTEIGILTGASENVLPVACFEPILFTNICNQRLSSHHPDLRILGLGRNSVQGTVPSQIGLMRSLMELGTDANQLEGTFPTEITQLSRLRYAYFDQNQFSGTLPTEIGLLSELEDLFINENMIQGTLPSEVGNQPPLKNLWFHSNTISGNVPSELGLLKHLRIVAFDRMYLTGTLPTELGNLEKSLYWLSTSWNWLTGTIPSEYGLLTSMYSLVCPEI